MKLNDYLEKFNSKHAVVMLGGRCVILNESYAANGQELPYPDISGLGKGTNWQEELFQTAPVFDNNLGISGGSEKVNYAFSASDLRQKGIIGDDKARYERTTAKLNLGADLTQWLTFNSSIMYSHIRLPPNANGADPQ